MDLKYFLNKLFDTKHLIEEIEKLEEKVAAYESRNHFLEQRNAKLAIELKEASKYPPINVIKNVCNNFEVLENEFYEVTVSDLHYQYAISSSAPPDIKEEALNNALRQIGGIYLERSIKHHLSKNKEY